MPAFDPSKPSSFETRHRGVRTAGVKPNGSADFETCATGYFEAAKLRPTRSHPTRHD